MKSLKIIWLVLVGYSAVVFQKVEPSQHIALDRGISPRALTEETDYLEKVLKELKPNSEEPDVITIEEDLSKCEASNNGNNSSPKICVGKKDKDTSVVFYSASERSEITLSGFSLKSEEVDLKNYFESFFKHLASQALSPVTKLSVVKSALQKQLQKKYENNKEYDLNKVWNSDSFDIVFDEKQNISLQTSDLELILPNAIRCKWDADKLLLTFATQYFESQITLAMTSKDEIQKEVSLALTEVIDQFERIKQFMYDEPAPNNEEGKPQPEHIKHLDCAKLLNIQENAFQPFKSLQNILGQKIDLKKNDEVTKIEFVYNDNLFEIQCHEPNEGSQFLVLEFKIGEVEGPNDDDLGKLKQIFPQESLYDLLPIAEAFYAETAWIISQIYPSEEKSVQ